MMKKTLFLVAAASMLLASCGNDEVLLVNEPQTSLKELNFTVGVVTKAGIVNGATFTKTDTQIGMFVTNNSAVETQKDYASNKLFNLKPVITADAIDKTKPWEYVGDKIYLSNQLANVYAYYPNVDAANVNRLTKDVKITMAATPDFLGDNQTDYMYAAKAAIIDVTAAANTIVVSNAVGGNTANLFFHHALSKLTFKIKKAANYGVSTNPCTITSIILTNTVTGFQFCQLGAESRMNLENGALSSTTADASTLTFAETGVTFNATPEANTAGQVTKSAAIFFIQGLVVPTDKLPTEADVTKLTASNAIKITLMVDGNPISGFIPATNGSKWIAGTNYTYTMTVKGSELIIDKTVTVVEWDSKDGASIDVAG